MPLSARSAQPECGARKKGVGSIFGKDAGAGMPVVENGSDPFFPPQGEQKLYAACLAPTIFSSSSSASPVYTDSRCMCGKVSRAPVKPKFSLPS